MKNLTTQAALKDMDAFDVIALINARSIKISVSKAFSLNDILSCKEINTILDHNDFATIKKLSKRRNLEADLINALED